MECEKCQELLSDYLDGALDQQERATIGTHLQECLPCFGVNQEVETIVNFCREHRGEYDAVPNERAMWLRISNTLESEQARVAVEASRAKANMQESENWWSRLMHRSWQLSLPQLATAVSAIAVTVALATAFGVRRVENFPSERGVFTATAENSRSYQVAGAPGNPSGAVIREAGLFSSNESMNPQQMKIEYLNQRLEQRMARWSPQTREAFMRNMQVIDQAMHDSYVELQRNPHDEVSEEMLNAALNDKLELLKEFSDL
ncbi:MAG: zf-HC2 domain-containing protein [Pyrinomonadaceae bacterium]